MGDYDSPHDILHVFRDYTDAELLDLSQLNAQALLMASAHALSTDEKQRETWIRGVADLLVREWDAERTWSPTELLTALIPNLAAYGCTMQQFESDEASASIVVVNYPDAELAASLGTDDREADVLFRIGEHIVRSLGRQLRWSRDQISGTVTLVIL